MAVIILENVKGFHYWQTIKDLTKVSVIVAKRKWKSVEMMKECGWGCWLIGEEDFLFFLKVKTKFTPDWKDKKAL